MRRAIGLAALGAATLGAAPVAAQSDNSIGTIPDSVCTAVGGGSTIDPRGLVQWLLGQRHIRDVVLDINGDGTTSYQEKVTVLATPDFCTTGAAKDRCNDEDKANQGAIHSRLVELADLRSTAKRKSRGDDRFTAQPPYSSRIPLQALLELGSRVMACAPSATPKKPAENGESTKFEALLNRARVAGSLDDLSSSRKDGVKGVKAAEFGGTGDLQDHSYTITTNAFAGMAWDDWLSPNAQYSLMPFVSYRHVRTQDNSAKEHVFGAGANGQLAVSLGWGGADVFNLASYYTTDSAQGQKIWTGTLDWEPGFFQQEGWPFGRFAPVVPDLVLMRVSPKAIFTGGNVFDNGGNADLADTKTFARVGGYIGLSFRGFPDTLLDRFEWTSTYKYLYGISGAVTNYHLFSSRISYVFPNRENYTFSAGYQVGRLEDTLQQVEKWDFAFGIRF